MAVRNQTKWAAPSGTGFIIPSSGTDITTQSGSVLLTQASDDIIINPQTYQPKYDTTWAQSTKTSVKWQPQTVVTVGNENLVTNLTQFLTDNLGNFIVTTTTYDTPKSQTVWSLSGV